MLTFNKVNPCVLYHCIVPENRKVVRNFKEEGVGSEAKISEGR